SGLLRGMLAELLVSRGFHITGQASTKDELLRLIHTDQPDVAILDIRLPPGHRDEGLHAAEEIRRGYPRAALLARSRYAEPSSAVRLLESASRAVGYLVKDRVHDLDHLVDSIARVIAGDVVIDPDVVRRVMSPRREVDPLGRLTPR